MNSPTRRSFPKSATALPALAVFPADALPAGGDKDKTPFASLHLVGPKEGYTPHIGTLVSMRNWLRDVVLYSVKGMTQVQLDHLHDPKANTFGAMLLQAQASV